MATMAGSRAISSITRNIRPFTSSTFAATSRTASMSTMTMRRGGQMQSKCADCGRTVQRRAISTTVPRQAYKTVEQAKSAQRLGVSLSLHDAQSLVHPSRDVWFHQANLSILELALYICFWRFLRPLRHRHGILLPTRKGTARAQANERGVQGCGKAEDRRRV